MNSSVQHHKTLCDPDGMCLSLRCVLGHRSEIKKHAERRRFTNQEHPCLFSSRIPGGQPSPIHARGMGNAESAILVGSRKAGVGRTRLCQRRLACFRLLWLRGPSGARQLEREREKRNHEELSLYSVRLPSSLYQQAGRTRPPLLL